MASKNEAYRQAYKRGRENKPGSAGVTQGWTDNAEKHEIRKKAYKQGQADRKKYGGKKG